MKSADMPECVLNDLCFQFQLCRIGQMLEGAPAAGRESGAERHDTVRRRNGNIRQLCDSIRRAGFYDMCLNRFSDEGARNENRIAADMPDTLSV